MRERIILCICALSLSLSLMSSSLAYAGQFEDGVEAYKRGDFQTSLRLWQPLAEEGHIDASRRLGDIYLSGLGGNHDYKQAAKWYRKAAEQGLPFAQYSLSQLYEAGAGVKKDFYKAYFWKCLAEKKEGPISDRDEDTEETRRIWEQRLTEDQRAEIMKQVKDWKPTTPDKNKKSNSE